MVLICPFVMKIYHRLLLHVIFYFKIEKKSGKSRFHGKATLVNVVAGYRNIKMHIKMWQIYIHSPVVGTLFSLS